MPKMADDIWSGDERREPDLDEAADPVTLREVHLVIGEVAGAMTHLADAITKNTRRTSLAQTIWLALLTLGIAFLSIIAVANYQSIQEGHRTGSIISDCVTPDGDCYRRGQEAQAKAIDQIKEDTNAAAERVMRQVECDAGIVCLPGFTPTHAGTTTTTEPKAES